MNVNEPNSLYKPCPFNQNFLIFKWTNNSIWELCLNETNPFDEYPRVIGRIQSGHLAVEGTILAMNLSWDINEEFRGQGIMSQFLELFLNEVKPTQGNCFAVVILKTNTASLRLAQKNGFLVYNEDDEKLYLKRES